MHEETKAYEGSAERTENMSEKIWFDQISRMKEGGVCMGGLRFGKQGAMSPSFFNCTRVYGNLMFHKYFS